MHNLYFVLERFLKRADQEQPPPIKLTEDQMTPEFMAELARSWEQQRRERERKLTKRQRNKLAKELKLARKLRVAQRLELEPERELVRELERMPLEIVKEEQPIEIVSVRQAFLDLTEPLNPYSHEIEYRAASPLSYRPYDIIQMKGIGDIYYNYAIIRSVRDNILVVYTWGNDGNFALGQTITRLRFSPLASIAGAAKFYDPHNNYHLGYYDAMILLMEKRCHDVKMWAYCKHMGCLLELTFYDAGFYDIAWMGDRRVSKPIVGKRIPVSLPVENVYLSRFDYYYIDEGILVDISGVRDLICKKMSLKRCPTPIKSLKYYDQCCDVRLYRNFLGVD